MTSWLLFFFRQGPPKGLEEPRAKTSSVQKRSLRYPHQLLIEVQLLMIQKLLKKHKRAHFCRRERSPLFYLRTWGHYHYRMLKETGTVLVMRHSLKKEMPGIDLKLRCQKLVSCIFFLSIEHSLALTATTESQKCSRFFLPYHMTCCSWCPLLLLEYNLDDF